jgi:hypothetical protein
MRRPMQLRMRLALFKKTTQPFDGRRTHVVHRLSYKQRFRIYKE